MSVRVMSWVWESSQSTGIDRLVLLAIADSASDDGGHAWPSIRTLKTKAMVSERTVQRAIRTLVELGELVVDANAGRSGVNVYRVVMTPRHVVAPVNVTPPSDSHPVTEPGPTQSHQNPRHSDTRTVLEPSTTPQPPADAAGVGAPHCKRHSKQRKGCDACAAAAAAVQERAEDDLERRRRRLADCPKCDPDGWEYDDEGIATARKCTHHRKSA